MCDLTIAAYWCSLLLEIYEPRTYVYPWGFCTLVSFTTFQDVLLGIANARKGGLIASSIVSRKSIRLLAKKLNCVGNQMPVNDILRK